MYLTVFCVVAKYTKYSENVFEIQNTKILSWKLQNTKYKVLQMYLKYVFQIICISNHCLHGSARQVVIGHVRFKGERVNFVTLQSAHP